MRKYCGVLTIFALVMGAIGKAKWPDSLIRCSRYDPNFMKCLRTSAQKAIPVLAKGIPSLGLSKLDPLEMINFTISNDRWPVTLKVDMTNAGISGQSKMELRDIRFDPSTFLLTVDGFHKKLLMYGQYKVRGNVLVFPLNSQGKFNFILRNVVATHTLKVSNRTREADHGNIGFTVRKMDRITMDLADPNFNKAANMAINKLVNDNWQIISGALTPSMENVIQKTFKKAFRPLFSKFSMDEIFPPARIKYFDDANLNASPVHFLHPIYPIVHPFIVALKK